MPVFTPRLVQCAVDSALNPHRVVRLTACFQRDSIYTPEANAGNPAKPKRAFVQNIHAGRAEFPINFRRHFGREMEWGQQRDHVAQCAVLGIRSFNIRQFAFCNPFDLRQQLRLTFQNVQRVYAEPHDDVCRRLFADAFDKAGTKIGKNAVFGLRHDFPPVFHLKLQPVFAPDPFAA